MEKVLFNKKEFNSNEELIEYLNNNYIKKDDVQAIKTNELIQRLKQFFTTWDDIKITKLSENIRGATHLITLSNKTQKIEQYINNNSNYNIENFSEKVENIIYCIKNKISIINDLLNIGYNIKGIKNIKFKKFIQDEFNFEDDFIEFKILLHNEVKYQTIYYHPCIDNSTTFKNAIEQYTMTELIGEWTLEDNNWNSPNLCINGINIEGLLERAKKEGKKILLTILD